MFQLAFIRVKDTECQLTRTLHLVLGKGNSLDLNQDIDGFNSEIKKATFSVADLQDIGYLLASTFKRAQTLELHIDDEVLFLHTPEVWVKWLSLGLALSSYDYKHRDSFHLEPSINAFELKTDETTLATAFFEGQILAQSQLIARELVNKPGNVIYPESFVSAVQDLPMENTALSFLTEAEMREKGFGGLVGISQGSDRDGRMLCLDYHPEGAQTTIALVGKGVTFDTGGISIKGQLRMSTMKVDMGGAAAVVGALNAIAQLQLPVRVVGLCGLVENMPSGCAIKPGDVVTMLSGKSVEIISTDAEGRMVLADVMHYAQQTFKPDYLIDIATLTGATGVSLGKAYASLMGNSDELKMLAKAAGHSCSEPLWEMPISTDLYEASLKSDFADVRHGSEDGDAGASVAATFLNHFVAPEQKWIHIDSAAMSLGMTHRKIYPKAASGYGTFLLTALCQHIASHTNNDK
ncbi:leucyl aminopeptidase family protein [Enterovibrio sp. ZSDZ42]|uniref:Leucyl aminopeptidase family protein n=1 Tax=Enterovibrio gelatinilyticus TaxID=2899819 RepID=A0ABT5QX10_9GAMM|nr:leucyl aminopeptidase family protein [Enterovibrio sp. ZSDZ42]MDD1792562.1 leucyl aminopeptidase family protein [Enterovibrio sp. ZSDZ42]